MPGLVPAIHVFTSSSEEDVDGRDKPGHDETFVTANIHDLPHRYADGIDCDPDVVAAVGHDGRDREDSRVPTRGDDIRDRRCRRLRELHLPPAGLRRAETAAAGLARRRRWIVRLSRAVFSGAALRAAGRGWFAQLPVAVVDRAVLVAAAGR